MSVTHKLTHVMDMVCLVISDGDEGYRSGTCILVIGTLNYECHVDDNIGIVRSASDVRKYDEKKPDSLFGFALCS